MSATPVKNETGALANTRSERKYLPDVDLFETDNGLVAIVDLPGVSKDGLSVRYENGVLTVEGAVLPRDRDDATLRWREHHVGDYRRVFEVREEIDVDGVNASYENGVLTIELPRVATAPSRKIPIG